MDRMAAVGRRPFGGQGRPSAAVREGPLFGSRGARDGSKRECGAGPGARRPAGRHINSRERTHQSSFAVSVV